MKFLSAHTQCDDDHQDTDQEHSCVRCRVFDFRLSLIGHGFIVALSRVTLHYTLTTDTPAKLGAPKNCTFDRATWSGVDCSENKRVEVQVGVVSLILAEWIWK